MIFLNVIAILLLLSGKVSAHYFYAPECCSSRDCYPVNIQDLIENQDGSWTYLPRRITFPKHQVKPSQDRNNHVCIGIHSNLPLCVYIVQGM
jgi:hypothetical protein